MNKIKWIPSAGLQCVVCNTGVQNTAFQFMFAPPLVFYGITGVFDPDIFLHVLYVPFRRVKLQTSQVIARCF